MYQSITEIAALIRADIKAALKSGALPAGVKVSVAKGSSGSSINVYVTALPAGFPLLSEIRIAHELAHPQSWHCMPRGEWCEMHAPESAAVLATIEAIVDAHYTSSRYESGGDTIYNCNFHKRVGFDSDLERADRARIEAKLTAPVIKPRFYVRAVECQVSE
jgi:hypothetical protein